MRPNDIISQVEQCANVFVACRFIDDLAASGRLFRHWETADDFRLNAPRPDLVAYHLARQKHHELWIDVLSENEYDIDPRDYDMMDASDFKDRPDPGEDPRIVASNENLRQIFEGAWAAVLPGRLRYLFHCMDNDLSELERHRRRDEAAGKAFLAAMNRERRP